jgi:16S rRNA (adenine1518-N6/adenine1519-N6)-dimethyltransferase
LQNKQQIQTLLAQAQTHPRHQFGQNFMIDGNLLRLLVQAGDLKADDLVIEVGAGTGSLTEELLDVGCHVVAVEIDRDLIAMLSQRLGQRPNFTLIQGDVLAAKHALNSELAERIALAKRDGQTVKLVANLPYHVASPLVIDLLIAGVDILVFTVQKEVARRLRAASGSAEFGPLTVMAQLLSEVEILRTLPPQAFWPMPKIESAMVRMTRNDRLGEKADEFGEFIRSIFAYRRKMLRKSMTEAGISDEIADRALGAARIEPDVRPQELTPAQWMDLFSAVNRA